MDLITEERALRKLGIPQDAFDMFVAINKIQVVIPPAPVAKILEGCKSERFFLLEEIDQLEIEIAPFMNAIRNQRRIMERDLTGESDNAIELLKAAKALCIQAGLNPASVKRLPNMRMLKWDWAKYNKALNALGAEIEIRAKPRHHGGNILHDSIDETLARLTKAENSNGHTKKKK